MSEIKGCMNCGNISCGNNKKRESAGCGRWKTPEQKIIELEGDRSKREKAIIELSREFNRRIEEYEKQLKLQKEENVVLKQKVEAYDRNRDRLIAMGFPHFRNCKEYAEKLKELEEEIAQLRESFHDYREQVKNDNETIKEWKGKALKIMRDISACELMKVITKAKQYEALDNLENFLREIPEVEE